MTVELSQLLLPYEHSHALACHVTRRVAEDRLLASAVHYLLTTEPAYIPKISPALEVLQRMYQAQGADIDSALEAVLEYTHLYMRHQVAFLGQGKYTQSSFDEVYRNVYDNEELMLGTYLPGLYLTQLYWPIHFRVLERYTGDFLERAAQAGSPRTLLEFGVGHGMTLLLGKRRFPQARSLAYDVSRHSLKFAEQLVRTSGALGPADRFEQADVVSLCASEQGVYELGTMGEILEHVEAPQKALANFRGLLAPGAFAFITTVIDSNAIDHIYQFSSQADIDQMITAAGFAIEHSELIRPADLTLAEPGSDPTRYYVGRARAL